MYSTPVPIYYPMFIGEPDPIVWVIIIGGLLIFGIYLLIQWVKCQIQYHLWRRQHAKNMEWVMFFSKQAEMHPSPPDIDTLPYVNGKIREKDKENGNN